MIRNIAKFAFFVLLVLSLANTVNAYTDREYAIYNEVINTPMSVSDAELYRRIGKKYGISPNEVERIADKVQREIFSGGKDATVAKENKVKKAVNRIKNVKVKTIDVSGELVAMTYLYDVFASNDKDVIKKVTKNMPKVLEAIFSVKGIERARIKAFFPAQGGGDKKAAFVDCYKSDFNINKEVDKYDLTIYE